LKPVKIKVMTILLKTAVFFLLGVFLSCSNAGKTNSTVLKKTDGSADQWIILNMGTQCSVKQPTQRLITTFNEFSAEWKKVFSGMDIQPDIPQVDFGKSWVVAAFMGEKNKGGFEISMASVQKGADSFVVTIRHITPGPNCMSSMAIEYPYVFAEIAQFPALKAEFKVAEEIKDCN